MDVLRELEAADAVLLNRHFVYKSKKHGSGYINMDPVFPDIYLVNQLCEMLAQPYRGTWVDVVAAPAVGGIILAGLVALSLDNSAAGLHSKVYAVWADKKGDGFAFERAGFADILEEAGVVVVEDLLTTGGSVKKVCEQVKYRGGTVLGVSAIVNRGGVTAEQLGVPRLESLAQVDFEAVDAETCELCDQGVPIVEDIGHGGEYKLAHPDYKGGYIKLLN